MDYNNFEELHQLIKSEISDKYIIASANIIYLEEIQQINCVVFITQFRDVLTHLSNIYSFENIIDSKEEILIQIERAKGHLERLCIDTFLKITEIHLKKIKIKTRGKEAISLETQIALKVKALRVTEKSVSFEEKCKGYRELIKFQEAILTERT